MHIRSVNIICASFSQCQIEGARSQRPHRPRVGPKLNTQLLKSSSVLPRREAQNNIVGSLKRMLMERVRKAISYQAANW